jgi:anti-anti-sigma factor
MSRSEEHSTLASIVWHESQGVRYVTVIGEVDLSNAPALDRALDANRLFVDMSGVRFIDSTGIRTLIMARMSAGEFDLVASRVVRKVLDLAAVTDMLNVATEDEPEPDPV